MKYKMLRFNVFVISMLAARGVLASAIFDGDTNQLSSDEAVVTIGNDILIGSSVAGDSGTPSGSLLVSDGTKVNGSMGATLGRLPGTFGRVDVTGAGSELNLDRALTVGDQGSGILNIVGGGKVTSNSWGGNSGYIGKQAGTQGIVNVIGTGSSWSTSGTIDVGTNGEGILNIRDNAAVTTGISLWVGRNEGSKGKLLVTDNGVLSIGDLFLVGIRGDAVVEISNGGKVTANVGQIGEVKGETFVLVTGHGSELNSKRHVDVGQKEGTAYLVVANGAKVTTTQSGAVSGTSFGLDIGSSAGDTGKVLISGKDSLITTNGLIGGDVNRSNSAAVGKGGEGELTLQAGGTLDTHRLVLAQQAGAKGIINIGAARGESAAAAGRVQLHSDGAIEVGSGAGELNFNHTESDYYFDSSIHGGSTAFTINVDSGMTTLTGSNDYTGTTKVNGGALRAGASNAFSENSNFIVESAGLLSLADYDQTIKELVNKGTVVIGDKGVGAILTVKGNYQGDNGLLIFNSVLNGDDSDTDRLIVEGNTSGTSRVAVNNLGGSGRKTLYGIELITVKGGSHGIFTQEGRIVAGAYDYQLVRGTGKNSANWYLSNKEIDLGPGPGPDPDPDPGPGPGPGPGPDPDPDPGPGPGPGPGKEVVVLRPEASAYSANLYAAASMFNTALSQRMGETEYTDVITGEKKLTSLWLKNSADSLRMQDSSGQLRTKLNRNALLIGGDLAIGEGLGGSTWRLGALAGSGNSKSTSRSRITDAGAKGSVTGYTAGMYATWFAEGSSERGFYADSVLQYSRFNNSVKGDDLQGEKYWSGGFGTTLETGYVFTMSNGKNPWFIQPKGSLSWSGIKADTHREVNGTRITGKGNNSFSSSLGVKAFIKSAGKNESGQSRFIKPFTEVNWIHNTASYGVDMDDVQVNLNGMRNAGEIRLGMEGRLTPRLNITGSAGQRMGSHNYSETNATFGVKYTF